MKSLISLFFAARLVAASLGNLAVAGSPWKASPRAARVENPVEANDASIAIGMAIWSKECASCHGSRGKGDGTEARSLQSPIPDLSDPAIMDDQSDGALYWKLTVGRRPMPGYGSSLSKEERWHVVNYMRTLSPGSAR